MERQIIWENVITTAKDMILDLLTIHSEELRGIVDRAEYGDNVSVSLGLKMMKTEGGVGLESSISFVKEKVRDRNEAFVSSQSELPFDGEQGE